MSQQPDWNVLSVNCPSRTSLARIANRWTAMIVTVLGDSRMRFGDIRNSVEGISGKVLTETLRELERDGLVARFVFTELPPRVEYELTPLGSTLYAPLLALCRWSEDNMTDVLRARDDYDTRRVANQ
jgi:DNA-binding HxlR family transcriptional regulator